MWPNSLPRWVVLINTLFYFFAVAAVAAAVSANLLPRAGALLVTISGVLLAGAVVCILVMAVTQIFDRVDRAPSSTTPQQE